MTGDENIQGASQAVIHMIALVNQLQLATDLLLASNPLLWPLALFGFANMAVTAVDTLGSYV
jgi:hypothetical protein